MTCTACCTTQSKRLHKAFAPTLFLASLVGSSPLTGVAQDTSALKANLVRLADLNSIDGQGLKPWHLHISYLTVLKGGQPGDAGTVEEWWAAPDRWRQEFTANGATSVTVHTPDGLYRSKSFIPPEDRVQFLLQTIMHPMDAAEITDSEPEMRNVAAGKGVLQCAMLSQPFRGMKEPPLGLFPTFCFQGDTLRFSRLSITQTATGRQYGTFQGKTVPVKVDVSEDGAKVLDGSVDQLGTVVPEAGLFKTEDLVNVGTGSIRVSDNVIKGQKIFGNAPIYPISARQARISGTVVLAAKIGADGHVHRARVLSSPDASLSLASLVTVQQWVYRPYILNGIPVAVNTEITVNFNINH